MAVARRDQATTGAPARIGGQTGPALRPRTRLELVPDLQPALRPVHRTVAGPATPSVLSPAQSPARPVARRVVLRGGRREGSLTAYLMFLLAGAAVGAWIVVEFLATRAATCSGADAAGNCVMQHVAAPALTRFAIVLVCAHGLATLVLDVLPDARRKLTAGYRLRRECACAPPVAGPVGAPIPAIAAACWAPVQAPRTPEPARKAMARAVPRAVCPSCVTVVAVRQDKCLECHGPVVQRRG
ncbi:MAG: hypothetical protein JWO02_1125 [Solirubrobacterales bacterium]|nr:hypothetical protein [Solirubrobacterales bacterium]